MLLGDRFCIANTIITQGKNDNYTFIKKKAREIFFGMLISADNFGVWLISRIFFGYG